MADIDEIRPVTEPVARLFLSGINRCFVIPRYQRDYSWNMKEGQPKQFFQDIVSRVRLFEGKSVEDESRLKYEVQSYFFGNNAVQRSMD